MRSSLAAILIFGLIVLPIMALATVLVAFNFATDKALRDLSRRNMETIVADAAESTEKLLAPGAAVRDFTARLLSAELLGAGDLPTLERYFLEQLRANTQLAGIYVGMPDGGFFYVMRHEGDPGGAYRTKSVSLSEGARRVELVWRGDDFGEIKRSADPQDTFDPRQRPWYQAAVTTGAAIWTDPYIFFTSRQPGITSAMPVSDGAGNLRAVVGVDLDIADISIFLARTGLGAGGSSFIMNRKGEIIAHSDPQRVKIRDGGNGDALRFTRVEELGGAASHAALSYIPRLAEDFALTAPVFTSFDWDGAAYHASFARVPSLDWPWIIGMQVLQTEFLAATEAGEVLVLFVSAVVGVFILVVGTAIAWSIGHPMGQLRANAKGIMKGDLEIAAVRSPYGDIREPAEAMEQVAAARRRSKAGGSDRP